MERQSDLFNDQIKYAQAWNGLSDLVSEAHDNAVEHGFYDAQREQQMILFNEDNAEIRMASERDFKLAQLAKICEEVGEACHAIRKGQEAEFIEELADICIRTFDLAGFCTAPETFTHALISKMIKNMSRPYLHGMRC